MTQKQRCQTISITKNKITSKSKSNLPSKSQRISLPTNRENPIFIIISSLKNTIEEEQKSINDSPFALCSTVRSLPSFPHFILELESSFSLDSYAFHSYHTYHVGSLIHVREKESGTYGWSIMETRISITMLASSNLEIKGVVNLC
ncbi:hypothetical protein AMTRI_Chr08g168370 [Amborella trichopoda]